MADRPATGRQAPLVCFIISTMNACAHLQECLDSIYSQSLSSWEIIIIDGGSCDGTVDVIKKNSDRLRYWLSEPDRGVYDAWNKALPHVTADWVMFLGADDGLRGRQVLSDLAPLLNSQRTRIVYGKVAFVDRSGNVMRIEGQPWGDIHNRFKREMCIPHQGVFHRRDIFIDRHFFDTSFRYAGDYDLLLGELLKNSPVFVDYCVANWRQGGLTSDLRQSIKVLREFRRARAKHGLKNGHPHWTELKAQIKGRLPGILGGRTADRLLAVYRKFVR